MSSNALKLERGRQLFVDDALIESTDLTREFHRPEWHANNPVLWPETEAELSGGNCPVACPFQDGVFYDPVRKEFRLYYQAGWYEGTALAVSQDGIVWERPDWGVVPGTNLILPDTFPLMRDGVGVWLDHDAREESERYKMFVYYRDVPERSMPYAMIQMPRTLPQFGVVYTSPDGIHWRERGRTGPCGDNTNFFYSPFLKRWLYSVRTFRENPRSRTRSYREAADFVTGREWQEEDLVLFADTDAHDLPDPAVGDPPQMYNVDAVAYESLMVGLFAIHRGPHNEVCGERGTPKITDLELGFSRDGGRNWSRPARGGFLNASREPGTWNYGYLHASGGICLVVGDRLYFYIGAFSGQSPNFGRHMYAGGSTGLATLRRDGFASMGTLGSGSMKTKLFEVPADCLYVNASAVRGQLRIAVLDADGSEIPGFGAEHCVPMNVDSTAARILWRDKASLAELRGRPVRLRFEMENARIYAFWLTADEGGASGGYVGAGGPGFTSATDGV